MFWNRKQKKVEVDPLQHVCDLIDEVNEAVKQLKNDDDYRHLRLWVRSGDLRTRARPKLMLGYWDQGGECFIAVHGED